MTFIAGGVCALACLVLLLPWLRTIPRLSTLPALHWTAGAGALAILLIALVWVRATPPAHTAAESIPSVASATGTQSAWDDVAGALTRNAAGAGNTGSGPDSTRAGSMDAAITALQSRLAKGGGSDDDWELLAKSYEFLSRPEQAAQARAHRLPTLPAAAASAPGAPAAVASAPVSGEVTLAPALAARAAAGATVFIVAKSLDQPGPPVAVLRTSVGTWPLVFALDDGQSMLPGRTLSGAGRISIEARISRSGQALAASGDLQGVSGSINPRDHKPVRILIDKVIP